MGLRRWRTVYVIAVAVVAAIGFVLGSRGHPAAGVVAGAFAVAAIGYGLVRLRPRRAAAWGMLAIAVVVLAVGETLLVCRIRSGIGFLPPRTWHR